MCSTSELIGFDDLSDGDTVPAGYSGFNWANLFVTSGSDYDITPNAVAAGTVSPYNVASAIGGTMVTMTLAVQPQFDAISVYVAVTSNGSQLTFTGTLLGVTLYTSVVTASDSMATFVQLNFLNIDRLAVAITNTGTPGPLRDAFIFDDFSVNLHGAS
ncbi:hypothetical protein WJX74_008450 [Apatococcus lobatus]|uniref:Uncharacterized protein n=1 Tax=Apatococcus lobatus TaxID=904363 RepID=A0AAW1SF49_9CHLO